MEQREIRLLVAGLGKLSADLFDREDSPKTALRLQVQEIGREIIKFLGLADKSLADYTVTVVPESGEHSLNGNELGDRISKALSKEWIPHLNDSESGQAFVYFNNQYLSKIAELLKVASVGKFTFYCTAEPFYLETSNWSKSIRYWDNHIMFTVYDK